MPGTCCTVTAQYRTFAWCRQHGYKINYKQLDQQKDTAFRGAKKADELQGVDHENDKRGSNRLVVVPFIAEAIHVVFHTELIEPEGAP